MDEKQHITRGRGSAAGTILKILGVILIAVGVLSGVSLPLIVVGVVVAGIGTSLSARKRSAADQQVYDAIVPGLLKETFGNDIKADPNGRIRTVEEAGIPLPKHDSLCGSGLVSGQYQGLPAELCNVRLTDVEEIQREETGLWEKNEREVYVGQWLLCELGTSFPTGFTIWPRGKFDKLFLTKAIQTGNELFDRKFNLSCDDEAFVLGYLNEGRRNTFLSLADRADGGVSVCLQSGGKLYIAVQSGHGFFDLGKGREDAEALRGRFTRELRWYTDMIDVFRPTGGV